MSQLSQTRIDIKKKKGNVKMNELTSQMFGVTSKTTRLSIENSDLALAPQTPSRRDPFYY